MKKNKKKNEKSEVKVEQAAVQQKPTSEKQSNSDETSAEMEMYFLSTRNQRITQGSLSFQRI